MSQKEAILTHLIKRPLDPITALKSYGCFRLAARISDLRNDGHDIKTHKVTKENKTFAVYELL
jgi:hypothetical protein